MKTMRINPYLLINEGNTDFNIQLKTLDGRVLNTRDMFFSPIVRDGAEALQVEMKAALNPSSIFHFYIVFQKMDICFLFQ
jgi:YidC/Oxa1 family membrane protein insertase